MNKIPVTIYTIAIAIIISGLLYPADRIAKKFDFKDFKKVEVSNGMMINISQSSSYSIEINAEEKDFEYLKVVKKGNTLEIYINKNNYRKSGNINIDIKMPSLTALDLSGGTQGKLDMDIKDNFSCELSGGAELTGNLACENTNMEISGGSTVTLNGKSGPLTADASGGSIYYLKDFSVKDVNADLSGGSRLEIKMDGTLDVDASGGSRVVYYGNANPGSTEFSGGSGMSKGD